MARKRKRRNSTVEIGTGLASVCIYTINCTNGYKQFTMVWQERGRRCARCFASMEERRMIASRVIHAKRLFYRALWLGECSSIFCCRVERSRL
ncbi:MAG: hypothetical protein RI957_1745 [Verrucomicrobiota bacterium]|jgi:hypothetical protein